MLAIMLNVRRIRRYNVIICWNKRGNVFFIIFYETFRNKLSKYSTFLINFPPRKFPFYRLSEFLKGLDRRFYFLLYIVDQFFRKNNFQQSQNLLKLADCNLIFLLRGHFIYIRFLSMLKNSRKCQDVKRFKREIQI